jgi:hypothetical protein
MNKHRVSITLTDDQFRALQIYARDRLMKPADIIRWALTNFVTKSRLKPFDILSRDHEESSGKVLTRQLSELFKGSLGSESTDLKTKMRKSAFWPVMRALVFERDDYKCRLCGGDGNGKLHVHHVTKRREGGQDIESNLVTVCPSCHSKSERETIIDFRVS